MYENVSDYVKRFGKILGRNYFYQVTVDGHRILESTQGGEYSLQEVIIAPTESELRLWVRLQCVRIRMELRDLL